MSRMDLGTALAELRSSQAHASNLERKVTELREIVAAMMVKYAVRSSVSDGYRAVLNPDVLGTVDVSMLDIDQSVPGMVVIRYGS